MKHTSIDLTLAVLLTFPVYLTLANNETLNDWFLYGQAWEFLQPLFTLGHALGIDRQAAIVIGTMFAISFVLSFIGAIVARAIVSVLSVRIRRPAGASRRQRLERYQPVGQPVPRSETLTRSS